MPLAGPLSVSGLICAYLPGNVLVLLANSPAIQLSINTNPPVFFIQHLPVAKGGKYCARATHTSIVLQ
jgi:hypothetical protein